MCAFVRVCRDVSCLLAKHWGFSGFFVCVCVLIGRAIAVGVAIFGCFIFPIFLLLLFVIAFERAFGMISNGVFSLMAGLATALKLTSSDAFFFLFFSIAIHRQILGLDGT